MICAACKQQIGRGELLACYSCRTIFHYRCLNMTTAYYMENKQMLMTSWPCPSCDRITRRNKSDETPTRKQHQGQMNDTTMSVDEYAVHDKSIPGNTPNLSLQNVGYSESNGNEESITLNQFRSLLDSKLEEKLEYHKKPSLLI